jgi:uncharacterized protein (TIGR02246 family)
MKTIAPLLLVLALVPLPACAPKVDDPADVQAIKQLMGGYFKAASTKDPAALQAVLTDKTILIEPHMAPLVGKEAIGKMHQAFLDSFDTVAQGPVLDVRVRGDLAVAYGSYAETITPKDGTLAADRASGHWVAVLAEQADRSWKWEWVIANSDQPMPGTTADGAEEQALAALERDWAAALAKPDLEFLDRVYATEWAANADGQVMSKAQVLAALKSGAYKLESMKVRDLRVHVFGDVAMAVSTVDARGTFMGQPLPAVPQHSTDFFVKRDGRWQAVSTQNYSIK